LLTHGTLSDIFLHTGFGVIGITITASALEGYLIGVGKLAMVSRGILLAAGVLTAFPEIYTTVVGLVIIGAFLAVDFVFRRLKGEAGAIE
jgi:hypothetical protein